MHVSLARARARERRSRVEVEKSEESKGEDRIFQPRPMLECSKFFVLVISSKYDVKERKK